MKEQVEFFKVRTVDCGEFIYPAIHAKVFKTKGETPYLKEPGVIVLAQSIPRLEGLGDFLAGFDESLKFSDYLKDPVNLDPALQLIKLAGQTCYMSFGEKRTFNKDAGEYLENLMKGGHGSVLEHPAVTFLIYGVSRSFTHELVRHRAGMAYSQESQRYVRGPVLRFVERPEFQADPELHKQFEKRIDRVAGEYEDLSVRLQHLQAEGLQIVSTEVVADKRKKVQQGARAVLTNETEAVIVTTGNLRAWRHIINMRANEHAEIEIRRSVFRIFLCLRALEPTTFSDFETINLPDGTQAVWTSFPKI